MSTGLRNIESAKWRLNGASPWVLPLLVLTALMVSPPALRAQNSQQVLATMGSEKILLDEIQNREIFQLREQLYKALQLRLHREIVIRLAKQRQDFSVTPPDTVSPEQVRQFYNKNGLSSRGSFEQLRERVRDFLMRREEQNHLALQFEMAVRRGLVVPNLRPPGKYMVRISAGSAYIRGNPKAPVMLLEFSDYQCPFCARAQPTLKRLRARYKNRVVFGYRHFPLPFHTEADEAALAIECARDQGKFESYHNRLFANQRRQFPEDLKRYAREVRISDLKRFDACLDAKTYETRLSMDIKAAKDVGISATPSFVVGAYDAATNTLRGEIFSGALSEADFTAYLEKYLKAAGR